MSYLKRDGTRAYKPYCGRCYKAGVPKLKRRLAQGSGYERPERLRDTGLRIRDDFNELVHPDGRIETPVPDWVRAPAYVFDCDGWAILKVLEPLDAA